MTSTSNAAAARFVGVWRLETIRDRQITSEKSEDGESRDHPDFGPEPQGLLFYTDDGHMSVQFMRRGRAAWSSEEEPAQTERAGAAQGYGSYAGRFEVDEASGVVLHHVEIALIPNRVGATLTRYFSFDNDRLTLRPPSLGRAGGAGGTDRTDGLVERTLTWRRVRA